MRLTGVSSFLASPLRAATSYHAANAKIKPRTLRPSSKRQHPILLALNALFSTLYYFWDLFPTETIAYFHIYCKHEKLILLVILYNTFVLYRIFSVRLAFIATYRRTLNVIFLYTYPSK